MNVCRVLASVFVFGFLLHPSPLHAQTVGKRQKEKKAAAAYRAKLSADQAQKASISQRAAAAAGDVIDETFEGEEAEDDKTFSVGANGATVTLNWNMYTIRDRLELVLPSSNSLPGVPLPSFSYFATGLVQGTGSVTVYVPPGPSSFQIIMNRGGGLPDTEWIYHIVVTQGLTDGISGVDGNPNQIKYNPFDILKDNLYLDPVDTSTGSHVIRKTLLSLGGARPLTFEINYASLAAYNGPIGTGWSHNHQTKLQGLGDGSILVLWSNKWQNIFKLVTGTTDTYHSSDQAAVFNVLKRNADNSYSLRSNDQSVWHFDASGRMTDQINSVGQAIRYAYNGTGTGPVTITEPVSGRAYALTYNAFDQITEITDNAGKTISFTYSIDLTDRLVGITTSEGKTSQTYSYTYDANGRVLTGTTPEGVTVFQDTYDSNERVASQTDARGNTSYFDYDETSQPGKIVTTITNRLGKNTKYVSDKNYRLLSATDTLGHVTSYAYENKGLRTSATDANGNQIKYNYDGLGNLQTTTDAAAQATNIEYNSHNQPVTITDAKGSQKIMTYDGSNRPLTMTDFRGAKTLLSYDSNSLLLSQTMPNGGVRQFAYTLGQLTQTTDADGNISKIEYDAKGRPSAFIDASGGRTILAYDINDNLISQTNQLGETTTAIFESRGKKLTETDALGFTTTFSYDGNGNLLSRQDALGHFTRYGYDEEDRVRSVQDANGNVNYFLYDDAGRLRGTIDPYKNIVRFIYDDAGNRIGVTDAFGNAVATTTFDSRNLPLTVQNALGNTTSNSYDNLGRLTSKTDALNRTTAYGYNGNSRLSYVTNPLEQTTAQTFDPDDNLGSLVNAKNGTTNLDYRPNGRLEAVATPNGARTSYGYDPRGLLTKLTQPSGKQSNSTYDAAGRRTSLTDGTGKTTFTYDAVGRLLTSARKGEGKITRVYDALGRLTKFTDYVGNVLGYTYDAVGNQTSIIYGPTLVVHYTYDANNRLINVTDWNNHQTTYAYDANGRLITTTRADGSVETRSYDVAGQLTGISDVVKGRVIYQTTRTFDAAGQVTSEDTIPKVKPAPIGKTSMKFDADNQLASFNAVPTSSDADGNMTQGPVGSDAAAALTYNSRNQLIGAGGLSYYYDTENFRTGIYNGSATKAYIYDRSVPLSRLVATVNPDGSATRYIYGLGLISDDEGGAYSVYHFDARGSTVAMTDGSGSTIGKASYGPFGEILKSKRAAKSTPFLFNGRYGVVTDTNGLYYMRARYYDSVIKRFTNQDPLLGSVDDGGGLNRFAFANGNPVSLLDPFGLSVDEIDDNSITDLIDDIISSFEDNISTPFIDFGSSIFNPFRDGMELVLGYDPQTGIPVSNGRVAINVGLDVLPVAGAAGKYLIGISRGAAIERLLFPGGNLIGKAGTRDTVRIIQGGTEDAQVLFQQLTRNGKVISNPTYNGTLVELSNGGTIGIRTTATRSPNTAATIDINNIPGISGFIDKIKFNP